MRVGECTEGRALTVAPNASLKEAQEAMTEHDATYVLVVNGDRLEGLLTDDKLKEIESRPALAKSAWEREYQFRYKKVEEVMDREPITVGADDQVEEALALVRRHNAEVVPVIEEGSKVLGVVTRDMLQNALRPVSEPE